LTFAGIVVLGYLLGSCPWGYWLVRIFRGEDVRTVGSGGIGISNVWRSYGRTLGIPLVFLDFGKGFLPAMLGIVYVSRLAGIAAGAAAMIGHWRPLFLRFERGGKMIATGGGVLFALAPLVAFTCLGIWLTVFLILGYSSVASICTALFAPIGTWLYGYPTSMIIFTSVGCVVVVYLHRANIDRLRHGVEHRSRFALVPRLHARTALPTPPR
jgi:glycerol-3-phosphate acyltransferase PlsY